MSASHRKKTTSRKKSFPPKRNYTSTNFYPLYDFDRDQVNPVTGVRPIKLQRIIPRYKLSTSDTRDEGVGPIYEDNPISICQAKSTTAYMRTKKKKAKKVNNVVEHRRYHAGMFECICEIPQVRIVDTRI